MTQKKISVERSASKVCFPWHQLRNSHMGGKAELNPASFIYIEPVSVLHEAAICTLHLFTFYVSKEFNTYKFLFKN